MTRSDFQTAVEEILELPAGSLKESDTRDTIDTWTSIADLQILTLISSEAGLEPDPELMEAESFGDLVQKLNEKHVLAA